MTELNNAKAEIDVIRERLYAWHDETLADVAPLLQWVLDQYVCDGNREVRDRRLQQVRHFGDVFEYGLCLRCRIPRSLRAAARELLEESAFRAYGEGQLNTIEDAYRIAEDLILLGSQHERMMQL